jgi:hypothetical protein
LDRAAARCLPVKERKKMGPRLIIFVYQIFLDRSRQNLHLRYASRTSAGGRRVAQRDVHYALSDRHPCPANARSCAVRPNGSGTLLLLYALVESRDIDDDALVRMRPSILTGSAVAPAGSAVACDAVAEPLGNRLSANSVPTAGGLGLVYGRARREDKHECIDHRINFIATQRLR